MDKLSAEQRHKNMAAIRGKDTKPEMIVRKGLWSRGFRYRLNSPKLPGHPDLVLRKYRTCIFINGCFFIQEGRVMVNKSKVNIVARNTNFADVFDNVTATATHTNDF